MTTELIENTQKYLFASVDEMKADGLTKAQQERMLRVREMYEYWLRYPQYGDKAIVSEARNRFHISLTQAYEDVRIIKICLGSMNVLSKDYYRWLFLQRCEEAFEMARENQDAKAFTSTLSALGKFTGLDKDDQEKPNYTLIVPQNFEISDNVEDAGLPRIPNVEQKAMAMYKRMRKEAEEAEYIEYQQDNESEDSI